jgi:hypothetical protein
MSPFDINSVVFHFYDFNYGRRSQPAACLEYFIFFSIDSSEARKQYDEYCLSIMQTIFYAHDRTHIRILIAPVVFITNRILG